MNFTSDIFIFVFMPVFFGLYFLVTWVMAHNAILRQIRLADILTVIFSLVFYMWACISSVLFLIALIIGAYLGGKLIRICRDFSVKKLINKIALKFGRASVPFIILVIGIVVLVSILYRFKYEGQISFSLFDIKNMSMPLGISFLTFSILSYWIDVYNGATEGSFLDVALYVSFFPKVISGPIVLWTDFSGNLINRNITVEKIKNGIIKIITGLAKKVIIADFFGATINTIQNNAGTSNGIDVITAWLICILYMQEIYFDFAGYSDVAIGLSKVIGINVEENFNFPYVSTSITEFWKRWHISLGRWFRKYVYIPLGGNRKGKRRTLLNSFIVMFISGIWHGAGLGYLLWGASHGICMVCEKWARDKIWYKKVPQVLKWAFTMLVVMMGWQVFRLGSFSETIRFFGMLVGLGNGNALTFTFQYYLTKKLIIMMLISIFGPLFLKWLISLDVYQKCCNNAMFTILRDGISLILFAVVVMCAVNSSYSPFIYFQY